MRHLVNLFVAAIIASTASVALASDGPPYAAAKDDASYTEGFDQISHLGPEVRIPVAAPEIVASNPAFDDAGYVADGSPEVGALAGIDQGASMFAAAYDDAGYAPPVEPRATGEDAGATYMVAGYPCCPGCSHRA